MSVQGRRVVDVSFLLAHTSYVLATRMTAAFAEIGITPREYCVLAHAMGGQYTQIELATIADLDKTTMLNSMDYLEQAGYAVRADNTRPSDLFDTSPRPVGHQRGYNASYSAHNATQ